MIYYLIIFVKSFKQFVVVHTIKDSASFTNRMHSPHWCSDINSFNSGFTANDRPYGWSTRWIILYNEFLNWNLCFLSNYFKYWWRNYISRIALIIICFYHNTFINSNFMSCMMFFPIIWMYSVSHISRYHKWSLNCLFKTVQSRIWLISQ